MSFALPVCALFELLNTSSVAKLDLRNQNGPDRPADERGRGTTCWFGVSRTAVIPWTNGPSTLLARYRAQPPQLADDIRADVPHPALSLGRILWTGQVGVTPCGRCREGRS